jgi:hypothetical protein
MRKLLTAALALVSALAFFIVGSPPASAFGSEVLGCDAGGYWSANSCISSGTQANYTVMLVNYTPQNTSGTYSTSWAVNNKNGTAVTQSCTVTYGNTPCISSSNSGSCAAGSMWCQIAVRVGPTNDKAFTAALTLTQSGLTRTITATATIQAGTGPCGTC